MKKIKKVLVCAALFLLCLTFAPINVFSRVEAAVMPEESDWDYGKKYTIVNPYETIDWATIKHYKSALHTHTSNSGVVWNDSGLISPKEFIAAYEKAGFDALVITDHDYVSFQWTQGFTPANPLPPNIGGVGSNEFTTSELLSMPGNELSKNFHTLAYGTYYTDSYDPNNIKNQSVTKGYDANIKNVAEMNNIYDTGGGFTYVAHPRRNDPDESEKDKAVTSSYSDLWWYNRFVVDTVQSLRGIEVMNAGQFSVNHSERLWDSLLTRSMPERPIYGTSSDDNHGSTTYGVGKAGNLGTGWTQILLDIEDARTDLKKPKSNEQILNESQKMFEALKNGRTYFSTYMMNHNVETGAIKDDDKPLPATPQPKIHSISVDQEAGTITVETDYASKVEWISGVDAGNTVSRVVKTDNNTGGGGSPTKFISTFNVETDSDDLRGYIRIRVIGDGGQTHTQPFGLKQYYRTLNVGETDVAVNYLEEKIVFGDKVRVSDNGQFTSTLTSGAAAVPGTTVYAQIITDEPLQISNVKEIVIPARPDTPKATLSSRNASSVKLATVAGGEYRVNGGAWQDTATFNNLAPSTEYTFEVRIKATSSTFASLISSAKISTKEGDAAEPKVGCGSNVLTGGGFGGGIMVICGLAVLCLAIKRYGREN